MGSCISSSSSKQKKLAGLSPAVTPNSLLDRFSQGQIDMLNIKFQEYEEQHGLDISGFKKLMPYISLLPRNIIQNAFDQFSDSSLKKITWLSFCSAISKYILGSLTDKSDFLYRLFFDKASGTMREQEAQVLNSHILRILEKNPQLKKPQISLLMLFEKSKTLGFDAFKEWTKTNIDLHKILQPLEIIPSPITERERIEEIYQEYHKGLIEGENYFLISSKWLNAWKAYVRWHNELEEIEPQNARFSFKSGLKPDKIDNSEIVEVAPLLKLVKGSEEKKHFEVLHKTAWLEFTNWYGGGPEIQRIAITISGKLQVEFFPAHFSVTLSRTRPKPPKPVHLLVSLSETAEFIINHMQVVLKKILIKNLFLPKGSEIETIPLSTPISQIAVDEITHCQVIQIQKPSIDSILDITHDFIQMNNGDAIEYNHNTYWNPGIIESINEEHFIIRTSWHSKNIKIPRAHINKLRKPAMAPVTSKSIMAETGLINIGNTCFMNSILQCFIHSPLINKYFCSESFHDYCKRSGHKFLNEIYKLYIDLHTTEKMRFAPQSFYKELLASSSDFQKGKENDSHEFLLVFLSIVHEALSENVYNLQKTLSLDNVSLIEEAKLAKGQWEMYRGNKGSVISAIFGSQTRNFMVCTGCEKKKTLFEVFHDFSLPIPVKKFSSTVKLVVVPRLGEGMIKIVLRLAEEDEFEEVLSQIEAKTKILSRNIVFGRIRSGHCPSLFQPISTSELILNGKSELYAFEVINTLDQCFAIGKFKCFQNKKKNWRETLDTHDLIYIKHNDLWQTAHVKDKSSENFFVTLHTKQMEKVLIERNSENLEFFGSGSRGIKKILHFPVNHMKSLKDDCRPFGPPQVVSVGSWFTWHELLIQLKSKVSLIIESSKPKPKLHYFIFNRFQRSCGICNDSCSGCKIEDSYESIEKLVGFAEEIEIKIIWVDIYSYKPLEIQENSAEEVFDIRECFAKFTEKELIEFNCEQCGGKNLMGQTEVWRLPDILVIHLKRFSLNGNKLTKINALVNFPLKGMDMSGLMLNSRKEIGYSLKNTKENYLYDLYAVVNHTGTISTGHYTAYCQTENGDWLFFDDERVFILNKDIQEEIVSHKAYILFYKRQRFLAANFLRSMR